MVLFDGEFIEDCVKAKTSNNQRLLAEKYYFSENLLKIVLKKKAANTQNAVILTKTRRANFGRFSWLIFCSLKKKEMLIRFDLKRSYLTENLLKIVLKKKLATTNAY